MCRQVECAACVQTLLPPSHTVVWRTVPRTHQATAHGLEEGHLRHRSAASISHSPDSRTPEYSERGQIWCSTAAAISRRENNTLTKAHIPRVIRYKDGHHNSVQDVGVWSVGSAGSVGLVWPAVTTAVAAIAVPWYVELQQRFLGSNQHEGFQVTDSHTYDFQVSLSERRVDRWWWWQLHLQVALLHELQRRQHFALLMAPYHGMVNRRRCASHNANAALPLVPTSGAALQSRRG